MQIGVIEIFRSLQGESRFSGLPALFIRLAGCNLRCSYCDTPHSHENGRPTDIDELMNIVINARGIDHVAVTGGEPLLQPNVYMLVDRLLVAGQKVLLETNGSVCLKYVPAEVIKIVDVKTPSSGAAGSFDLENLSLVGPGDEYKFVISSEHDLRFTFDFIQRYLRFSPSLINLSPVHGAISPEQIAQAILDSGLCLRLNLQLHRIIWPQGEPSGY